ncbi:MAG: hypothetical protein ABI442_18750 [Gemmatimonadaceae bacterium]
MTVLSRTPALLLSMSVALAVSACSSRAPSGSPPGAEFLISTSDSSFWVTAGDKPLRVRGVPLVLARYDDHFYEIYAADDDYSFDDALLLGQRLYRRDLSSGDSAVVLADTIVGRIALGYARAHPDERPLAQGEEGEANPTTSATAEIDILDVFGPYVSYEFHADVQLPGRPLWHTSRRGVIDLRSGHESTVADVFGSDAGARLAATGRHSYEAIRDSIERQREALSGDERRAADALAGRQFDERSFSVENESRLPAVAFAVPGRGDDAAGNLVELEPMNVDSVGWWKSVSRGLAVSDISGASDVDRWTGKGYSVIARYDTSGEVARVSIADSRKREFNIATITGPILRIDWLDDPAIAAADRDALSRAFNQAARYDEATRVASASTSRGTRRQPAAGGSRFSHSMPSQSSFVRVAVCQTVRRSASPSTRPTECVQATPSTRAGTKRPSS